MADVLLGSGADVKSLNWQVTSDEQFCQVTFTPKESGTPAYTAVSRTARGSCRISFKSKVDESTGTTKRYTVHGTANATVAALSDETKTVTLTVTF